MSDDTGYIVITAVCDSIPVSTVLHSCHCWGETDQEDALQIIQGHAKTGQ